MKTTHILFIERSVQGKNQSITKAKVNIKIYDITDWKIITTIHILCNISRCKGNQTMKLGQLMEYNISNTVFEKST